MLQNNHHLSFNLLLPTTKFKYEQMRTGYLSYFSKNPLYLQGCSASLRFKSLLMGFRVNRSAPLELVGKISIEIDKNIVKNSNIKKVFFEYA